MKRIMAAILCLIILFVFSACQPTPEKGVVAKKDSDLMLEEAQKESTETNSGISLSEQYGIPDSYTYETSGADGLLNISVDAQVIVPEDSAMPIYRVQATEFSQKIVSAFYDALCGDAEMYIPSDQLTKDEIQERIISLKKGISNVENEFPEGIAAGEKERMEEELEELEKQLETAPNAITEERTYGELIEVYDTETDTVVAAGEGGAPMETSETSASTTYTGLDAYEKDDEGIDGKGRIFQVANNSTPTMLYSDYRNSVATVNFAGESILVTEDTDVDAEVLSSIGLKPSEAKQIVQRLLDETSSGMVVDSIYLQNDGQESNSLSPGQYAYKIYCVRSVDGFSCSYVTGGSQPEDGATAPYWIYEEMYFMVNSDGIFSMIWFSPIEVADTVNEDAQLKPFSEIQEIFEKMMTIEYEVQAEFGGTEYDFEIDRVTLSLHRIVEQNSNESGLLVPAWNFYGKLIVNASGEDYEKFEELGKSFMTINAIDGSIIDTGKGY